MDPVCIQRVKVIREGSGYLTACMARMVAPLDSKVKGKVFGIEYIEQLYQMGLKNLQKDKVHKRMLQEGIIEMIHGDGWKGLPQHAPFNAIHVGAAAESMFFLKNLLNR